MAPSSMWTFPPDLSRGGAARVTSDSLGRSRPIQPDHPYYAQKTPTLNREEEMLRFAHKDGLRLRTP